ncbi:MAG: veratrol--corrinoid protein metyltransferase [Oscillospiraceae bacterium]|jgi:hypothetical protein|nr:veratrol--corrinoid protein metyltransferase [Oscillospiraceae bacterium]
MLTEKENFLMLLNGEQPEWVPNYNFWTLPKDDPNLAVLFVAPPFLDTHRAVGKGGRDIWGVNYVPGEEAGGATLPEPNNFILDDVTRWRDIIKAPDVSGYNWEKIVKDQLDGTGLDRKKNLVSFNVHFGYFQLLMSFMGFTEGLCALHEEPEEVKALLHYLADFYCDVTENMIDHYKPDILSLQDDTAAWGAPFISRGMYDDILVPVYDRHAKFARDRGIPVSFHNCGKCEGLLEPLVDIGVRMWDPAQTCNDLVAVKQKFGNKLVIAGGWDGRGRLMEPDVTDEELYESVRVAFDKLAPGGGYCFCGGFLFAPGDKEAARKNAVILRAVDELGHSFYN